jgi:four helix bundle protein
VKSEGVERRDLPARTFEFARRVVTLCRVLDKAPSVNRILAQQLLRSACSVGANVEEGQGSQSRADFVAKYYIACKEARETHYWLRLLIASDTAPPDQLKDLTNEADQLVAILTTIVKKARRGKSEG